MNYRRSIIFTIPLFLSAHICWTMMEETQIIDSQAFQDQIDGIKEKKEKEKHKKQAKKFTKIGCILPCFCPVAYYHYCKAR